MFKFEELKDYNAHKEYKYTQILLNHEYTADELIHEIAEQFNPGWGSIILNYAGMVQDCTNYNAGSVNYPLVGELQDAKVRSVVMQQDARFEDGCRNFFVEINAGYVHQEENESK